MTVFNNREDTSHSWFSIVLVATQFLLIVLIMFAGPLWPTHWGLKGMMVVGGGIGLWAFLAMGLGNIGRSQRFLYMVGWWFMDPIVG